MNYVMDAFRVEELETALKLANEEVKTKDRELTASVEGKGLTNRQEMSAIEAERDAALAERDDARKERDLAIQDSKDLRVMMEQQEARIAALERAAVSSAAVAAASIEVPPATEHLPSSTNESGVASGVAIDLSLIHI